MSGDVYDVNCAIQRVWVCPFVRSGDSNSGVKQLGMCALLSWPYERMTPAEFDLEAVRATLDEQGMAIAGNQEASLKSRRQLADVTKSALWGTPCLKPYMGSSLEASDAGGCCDVCADSKTAVQVLGLRVNLPEEMIIP